MDKGFDVIIVGKGPAGISAALYTARGGLSTLIIGKDGGALEKADKIENYYGFSQPISANELLANGVKQAQSVGAKIVIDEVVGMGYDGKIIVKTKENEYKAKSVILATGSSRTVPKIDGILEYEGRGVSYCAVCDAFFYRGKDVAVLGDGDYALHEALELVPIAKSVTILTNGNSLKIKIPDAILVNKSKIKSLVGTDGVFSAVMFDSGEKQNFSGIFVAIGVAGSGDLARKLGAVTENNRIVVDNNMATNLPGLYSAGDSTGGMLQIAKAVYEGAKAGMEVIKYVRKTK